MKCCARFTEDDGEWVLADCSAVDDDHQFGDYSGCRHIEMHPVLISAASGKFTRP
jgi:hypothetical protein